MVQQFLHTEAVAWPLIAAIKITGNPRIFYCFGAAGLGVVVGRGRDAEGAEGTAGAETPEEAL
jgi:hypothetical protein